MEFLNEMERFIPILIFLYLIYKVIKNYSNRYELFGYILTDLSNRVLKNYVFKPMMGDNTYPIIGRGARPPGAMNCGFISTGKRSNSYGMPSGHTQLISYFLSYELLNSDENILYKILLTMVCIYMVISRIRLGCHTNQQVIMGSLFGFGMAYSVMRLTK